MIPFKFFSGKIYTDEYTIRAQPNPPEGISRRHWNMIPQDIRDGDELEMSAYIQGWETLLSEDVINPYSNWILGNLWTRGFEDRRRRIERRYNNVNPNPPIDETYPEYYNTDEFVFFDVTEVMPDPDSNQPYKFMLFRHIEEGNTVQGQRIYPPHPMYNFPDVI
jgi:hypothetical protein